MSLTKVSYSMIAGAQYNVLDYISGGSGTLADPWVGWDTNTPWGAGEFYFPSGYFAFSTTLELAYQGINIIGNGFSTVLKFNGTGNAISFDGGVTGVGTVCMKNFLIQGNPNATNGIFINNANNGILEQINVIDVNNAALLSHYSVLWTVTNFRCSLYDTDTPGTWGTRPKFGMVLGVGTLASTNVTAWNVNNVLIQDVSEVGILIENGAQNTFLGGLLYGNGIWGIQLTEYANWNVFVGTDAESNECLCSGYDNHFFGVLFYGGGAPPGPSGLTFDATSKFNKVYGGEFLFITIEAGATRNIIDGATIYATNQLTNNGIQSSITNVVNQALNVFFKNVTPLETLPLIQVTGSVARTVSPPGGISVNTSWSSISPVGPNGSAGGKSFIQLSNNIGNTAWFLLVWIGSSTGAHTITLTDYLDNTGLGFSIADFQVTGNQLFMRSPSATVTVVYETISAAA